MVYKKEEGIINKSLKKNLFKLFIPTLISYVLFAANTFIDGVFVSNHFGAAGITAMNLNQPFYMVVNAIIFSMAIGSLTYVGIELGKNDPKKAGQIFTQMICASVILSTIVGILMLGIAIIFFNNLLDGIDPLIITMAVDYLKVFMLGVPIFAINIIFTNGLRLDGKPSMMVYIMVLGIICNASINYIFLFVLNLGIWSSAFGTIIANMIQLILYLIYYIKYSRQIHFYKFKFEAKIIWNAFINGSSDGMIDFAIATRGIVSNFVLIATIGIVGVAIAGYINYLYTILAMIMYALADTINPFISMAFGAKDYKQIEQIRTFAIRKGIILGIILYIIIFLFTGQIFTIFNVQDIAVQNQLIHAARIQYLGLALFGYNQVQTTYLTSIDEGLESLKVSVFRNLLSATVLILVLPFIFGGNAIWWALPCSEFISFVYIHNTIKRLKLKRN